MPKLYNLTYLTNYEEGEEETVLTNIDAAWVKEVIKQALQFDAKATSFVFTIVPL